MQDRSPPATGPRERSRYDDRGFRCGFGISEGSPRIWRCGDRTALLFSREQTKADFAGGLVPDDAGEGQIQLLLRLNFTVTSPHPDCVIVSSETSRLTAMGDLSEQVDPCSGSSLLGGAFTDERAPHAPIQVTSLQPPRLEFA